MKIFIITLVSPCLSKEVNLARGYCYRKTKSSLLWLSCLLVFSVGSWAQSTLTLEHIHQFKKKHSCISEMDPQSILQEAAYFVRFQELGKIYNPTFPKTRNRVYVETYQQKGTDLVFIGKSISTHRATVRLQGRVGAFFSIMKGAKGTSMLAYQVQKKGKHLVITGKVYQ